MHFLNYLKSVQGETEEKRVFYLSFPWPLSFPLPPKAVTLQFPEYFPSDSFSAR